LSLLNSGKGKRFIFLKIFIPIGQISEPLWV